MRVAVGGALSWRESAAVALPRRAAPEQAHRVDRPGPAPATPMLPRQQARPTILVIDDDVSLLDLLAVAFAEALPDADVRLAATAREGECAALAWPPDVILCDVHLPDDDGRRLMARLRARPGLARVPGVLMTGLDISCGLLREEAAAVRADLLRKPFELVDLLRMVSRALSGQIAN